MKRFSVLTAAGLILLAACQNHEPDTGMVLAAPENVRCTGVTGVSLAFAWDAVPGAEQYAVRLVTTEDGASVELKYETTTSTVFSELETGTSYTCMVRAIAGMEYSEFVSSEPVVTGEDVPDNPDDPGQGDSEAYKAMLIPAAEDELGTALAFPGAEGGGMYTTGGRGGRIIRVTNLNDSGEGSLRAAVEATGARIVVFDVAGIIDLQSQLKIRNGNLTIAGQTAPGDGICIKNYATVIEADNVIIRFVRFRLGNMVMSGDGEDCIWGRRHSDIILDHCSMSWSIDECASFYGNANFTMQWCILTESLRNSMHDKGNHGYGGIWGGENASFHHNMLSNHDSRNPRFDHPEIYENPSDPDRRGNVDYRNNAVYNWGSNSTYGGEGGHFNMVANYYRKGPASRDRRYFMDANGIYTSSSTDYGYPYLYLSGNYYYDYPDMTAQDGVYWHDDGTNTPPDPERLLSAQLPLSGPAGQTVYTTTHSAADAFARICEVGGASLVRDAVDERACSDAQSGTASVTDGGNGSTGGIIDTPSAAGGWPEYSADTANEANDKTDTDGDGMPDWFEEQFGLDVSADDAGAVTIDIHGRYTNIEMYLHYLVRNVVAAQVAGGIYTPLN